MFFFTRRIDQRSSPLRGSVFDDLLHANHSGNNVDGGTKLGNQLLDVDIVGHLHPRQESRLCHVEVYIGFNVEMGGC